MPRTVGRSLFSRFVATDPFLLPEPLSKARSTPRRSHGNPLIAFRLPDQEGCTVAETPIHGHGAVTRWLDLHDVAVRQRAQVKSGDAYAEKQALRAIASLFRYEHELTPDTRRKAREALWRLDRDEPLPALSERRSTWELCRCPLCLQARALEGSVVPPVLKNRLEGVA